MAITRIGKPAIADVRGVNFRNIIINGGMDIAQRGTSSSNVSSGYHTCDRWKFDRGVGTVTVSQETDAPTGSGFVKSFKVLEAGSGSNPSAGDTNLVQHLIEGQNLQYLRKGTSSAKPLTASFYVKGNLTGTYILELRDRDNSRQVSKSYTISSANTWEYKTISFPADTTGALDNDNATSLQFNFWVSAGTNFTSGTLNTTWNSETTANRAVGQVNLNGTPNNYIQWTGIQLETGSQASDFEFLPHDVNLRRCLRYYYQDTAFLDITVVRVSDSSRGVHKTLPVPMRATPTFTATSTNEIGNTSMNNSSNTSVRFSMSGSADNHPRYAAYNFSAEL
jgi:hypothetical protein